MNLIQVYTGGINQMEDNMSPLNLFFKQCSIIELQAEISSSIKTHDNIINTTVITSSRGAGSGAPWSPGPLVPVQ